MNTQVMESTISGRTGLLALIGSPVGHSGSPAMYNYSFARLGLDYVYVAFDIKEDEVADAIAAMKTFKMRGCNVTMPCKTEVVKYMDELSPAARMIGAVNTIVNDNGKLTGYMTDGEGFINNLKDHGITVAGKKTVIAGSGGAATAIQVQCALDGVREISIFNRTASKAIKTAEKIKKEVPACRVNVFDIADVAAMTKEIRSAEIFINATSVGMKPMDKESIVKDTAAFYPGLVVADAVYNPVETRLLREAKEAGCTCVGGKGMLLWQGAAAFKLYTGQEMPVAEVKEQFFSERKNIYLIGFMGTGKSTVGSVLAEKLGTKCVEMDERIETQQQMTITEIFDRYGEKHFRDLETELLHSFVNEDGLVISCGGGSVLRDENAAVMKQNGSIVLLTAEPESIYERVKHSTNRPVLNGHMNVAYIRELMEKRRARYETVADVRVATDGKSAEAISEEILAQVP